MATYAIGDVQGCYQELCMLLDKLAIASDDQLWFVGDLVSRGPDSLNTVRLIRDQKNATVVLGNHDLHLVAIHHGIRRVKARDKLDALLTAPNCDELVNWICQQPLFHFSKSHNTGLVHAGIPPQWDVESALEASKNISSILANPDTRLDFLTNMYGDEPALWHRGLGETEKLRYAVNCFTRMRYCMPNGELEFRTKTAPGTQSPPLKPWFELADRKSADTTIVFGHWSTLGAVTQNNVIPTDTGCVWGGELTAIDIETRKTTQVSAATTKNRRESTRN